MGRILFDINIQSFSDIITNSSSELFVFKVMLKEELIPILDRVYPEWRTAVNKLSTIDVNINIHFIIKDKKSVDTFKQIYDEFKDKVSYFVLLPLMKSGRATSQYEEEAFHYLLEQDFDWFKIAFGAHFYDLLKTQNKVRCWMYPPESFSKNLILDDTIQITPSSFNLTPLISIQY